MSTQVFRSPRDIIWGRGSLSYLEKIPRKRVLIVTDKVLTKLGVTEKATGYLKKGGAEVRVFDEVEPEPSFNTVMREVEEHKGFDPDVIVGIGGGSCIDASKAFRVLFEHPHLTLADVCFIDGPPKVLVPPFKKTIHVAVSSTSGTGSEATFSCILTDTSIPAKRAILSSEIMPQIAIVDPDLADSMPPEVRADTGIDALTHGIESYVCAKANDFSRGNSLQAITLIMKYLPSAFLENDPVAREHVHYGATLAGVGFANSALGISHSIALLVGATFKLTHGRANAIVLPFTIKYNASVAGEFFAQIGRSIGYNGDDRGKAVDYLIQRIDEVKKQLKVQRSFKEVGIGERAYSARVKEFATKALVAAPTLVNPRKPTMKEMEDLFLACYRGDYSLL